MSDERKTANGKECMECATVTPGDTDASFCETCSGEGMDPCVELVHLSECPDPEGCRSEFHHFGLRKHVEPATESS